MTGKHSADDFFTEFDATFFSDGYKMAEESLKAGISEKSIMVICEQLYHSIDQLNISFTDQCCQRKLPVDCKKGCSYCCHQSVFAVPHEVFYMMQYMEKSLTGNMRDGIRVATKVKNGRTGKMTMQQLLHYKEACPLLDDTGQCIAYDARPMACRIYLSSDVSTCRNDFKNPYDLNHFPSLYEFPLRAGRMLNEGVCTFLGEKKIIPFEWTLESSLNIIFEDKQALRKWLNGENMFQVRDVSDEEIEYLQRFEITRKGDRLK